MTSAHQLQAAYMTLTTLLILLLWAGHGQAAASHSETPQGASSAASSFLDVGAQYDLRHLLQYAERISGGSNAPRGRFPYMLSLRNSYGRHVCGALLIDSSFCVTAAHCVDGGYSGSVIAGAYFQSDIIGTLGVQERRVTRVFIHPSFDSSRVHKGHDIAVLVLSAPLSLTPIPLPSKYYDSDPDDRLLALGWGKGSSSPSLQQAFFSVVSSRKCADAWDGKGVDTTLFSSRLICAYSGVADTCNGDSGGPLLAPSIVGGDVVNGQPRRDTLVALTSFGDPDCGRLQLPGVYTFVPHYVSWIKEKMRSRVPSSSQDPPRPPPFFPSFPPPRPPQPPPPLPFFPCCSPQRPTPPPPPFPFFPFPTPAPAPPPFFFPFPGRRLLGGERASKDDGSFTSLIEAAQRNHVKVLTVLLKAGADVDARSPSGWTALMWAAYWDSMDMLKALVDAGADLDVRTTRYHLGIPSGSTALHVAVHRGATDAVKVLVDYGASTSIQDSKGLVPKDYVHSDQLRDLVL